MDDFRKICIVGVLDNINSTNVYMAKAFARAGFGIVPINYRNILAEFGVRVAEKTIIRVVEETKPVLTVFCKCNGIDSITMGKCSNISKTWFWWMDPLITLKQIPESISHAQMADFSSCTGLGVAEYLSSQSQKNVFHIFEGIDPEIFYPVQPVSEYETDISFIGTRTPERQLHIDFLRERGFKVKAYGNGFEKEVVGDEFNIVCSSSKAMLAINNEHTTKEYFSDRIFRYGACRSFVLHSYSPGMEKHFNENEHVVYFNDKITLLEAATKFVNSEHSSTIAQNLHNKIILHHTWDIVAKTIIHIVEEHS